MKRDSLENLVHRALELHRSGRLREARGLYEQALEYAPGTADLWHLLGKIALQEGKSREALPLIQKAVDLNEKNSPYYASLAVAYQNLGMNDAAISAGLKAIAMNPANIAAINALGNAYAENRSYETAEKFFLDALTLNPNLPEVRANLGNLYCVQGRYEAAVREYLFVLSLKPDQTDLLRKLGKAYLLLDKPEHAVDAFLRAQKLDSGSVEGYLLLGEALLGQKNYDAAAECFRQVLLLNPNSAAAYIGAGKVSAAQEQFPEAMASYSRALELNPENAEAFLCIGNALRESGRADESIHAYQKAIEMKPDFGEVYYNISNSYYDMDQLPEAEEYCRKALEIKPDFPDARCNMAWTYLAKADYEHGWVQYEWRLKKKGLPVREFPFPRWDGSVISGKRFLILAEQGVGDEIMFSSCLQDIMGRTAYCVIECDKRLLPLFRRSFPALQFIERFEAYIPDLGQFDYYIEIGSLPRFLRPDISSFPVQHSFLASDDDKVKRWHERFGSLGNGLAVGISWRGGSGYFRRLRSIAPDILGGVFSLQGVHFINLQYGDCKDDIRRIRDSFGVVIHDWEDSDPLKDLDDFAAKIAALDLVVSVDNSTVHMAGALGRRVWTILPVAADWRWARGVNDTPWYKTMVLFRQETYGDWSVVVRSLSTALSDFVLSGRLPTVRHSYRDLFYRNGKGITHSDV